jgi:hypothetical protein
MHQAPEKASVGSVLDSIQRWFCEICVLYIPECATCLKLVLNYRERGDA